MNKYLFALAAIFALVACSKEEPNKIPNDQNEKPLQPVEEFVIDVNEESLRAYEVTFSIYPEDKDRVYYCDVMSKARWAQTDIYALIEELDASLHSFADMTGSTYQEVVDQMLNKGDTVDFCSNAGYRGDMDYVIYAFYWDVNSTDVQVTTVEFRTPSPVESTENVAISFDSVEPTTMNVVCEPTSGVVAYYYYFAESVQVDAMLAEMEDDIAYISYHAMNVSTKHTEAMTKQQIGLKAETEYCAIVVLIDKDGNRRQVSAKQSTAKVVGSERVESELFESLLGEWQGTQLIYDGFSDPYMSSFTVTIVDSVEGYDHNYREHNQLVALVDGWANIAYYGVDALAAEGIEDPEEKFGPKWVLNIAEGDVVTIDGRARTSVIGWLFMGHCFMVSGVADGSALTNDNDLNVTVSEDGNTINISSPVRGSYPSLAYNLEGFGWMANFFGNSAITLTRK